ncbi:MAG: hypothetical protein AAFY10_01430 [Pseudomonadota bacterium]
MMQICFDMSRSMGAFASKVATAARLHHSESYAYSEIASAGDVFCVVSNAGDRFYISAMALKLPGGWVISKPGAASASKDLTVAEPVEVIEAEIVEEPAPLPAQNEAPAKRKKQKPPKRPLLVRLFGVSIWGGIKLVLLCILIGSVILLWQGAERAAEDSAAAVAGEAARQLWSSAVWAAQNFWRPALYGAGVVAPVWVLWRVLTLPFRR